MSSLRPESHVTQQIRREKLRIQQLQDFPNNLEQSSLHPGLNSDLVHVRNVRNANMLYEPAFYSSEMVNISPALNPLFADRDAAMTCQELGAVPQFSESFPHSSDPASSSIHAPSKEGAPRNFGSWRNSGSHQGYDWMVNYATSSVPNETIPNSLVAAELNNVSAYQQYMKPSYNELNDVQCSLSNISMSNRESQRQFGGTHNPSASPPLYHNTLQDIVKSASISAQGSEMASVIQQNGHGIWDGNGSELVLLPHTGYENPNYRTGHDSLSWNNNNNDNNNPLGFTTRKSEQDSGPVLSDSNPHGLSLSLSSNAQSKLSVSQFGEGCGSEKSILKPSVISKDSGKSIQDIVGGTPSNAGYRNVGPLGPFTGYATILKNSRFIRPAQQLLDEFCCNFSCPKPSKARDVSERVSREASASAEAFNAPDEGIGARASCSGASSSMFYSSKSNEMNSGDGGAGSSLCPSSWPEYQQKKAKLLYMQEEVTRRYKQYHQQMQMVVSSFQSVAGLSSATPYISTALKSVSRHFRCLKNAITDQLKHIREVLGEDSSAGTSSKLDNNNNAARLRFMDHSFLKNKSSGGNMAFLEPQHHVWRPQRGLPERSVAILRAWLFEHFLHPYPTDTDKHMLATQTGLSRNQVSNWFINARVRVWKPMVEEIHSLEAKGLMGANQNSTKCEGICANEGTSQSRVDQSSNKFGAPEKQMECLEMGSYASGRDEEGLSAEDWNQEKRSKMDCEITSSMDGTLMGFVPYRRAGAEVGGLGSVSLTLGLRHGVEGAQHVQQHELQQEDQVRHHFGGQMIHDFVG
ncbi:hypothetical protein L6164_019070 [Bauhinia variegata]|uniref:Uncharacterized protein n=1 Tax=Bauhinia variegata TaxID=167791 RepID=A0ACB9NI49_BAUVA|nr:hypothetical protein L6164_019070 [Bauhinia variegata]